MSSELAPPMAGRCSAAVRFEGVATTVQRLGRTTNLVHGFIYFSLEARERFAALGLAPRQQYFASRAAAMGPVDADAVIDSFYNFNPDAVRAAMANPWEIAAPETMQQARFEAVNDVLGVHCADIDRGSLDRAIEIATAMVDGVPDVGKPLAAGNRTVERPVDPLLHLWQLVTIGREWRGDAHVQVLRDAAVSGIESLVLHGATGQVPIAVLKATRAWSETEWSAAVAGLADRGLVHADGTFTPQGEQYRKDIEAETNRAAQALVDAVGDESANELCDALRPIRDALVASGVFANSLS